MPTEARMQKLARAARRRQAGLTVVIEDVFDPHNLGAVARSCDAFGVQELHVIFDTHPEFDPKEVGKNSSASTNKWLHYRIHRDTETAIRTLQDEGWLVTAAVIDDTADSIFEADLSQPQIALLFGNEKTGLSPKAAALADRQVTIPMQGIAQSMNISVAAALFLYEATRQRRAKGLADYQMDKTDVQQTLDYFLEMQAHLDRRRKARRKQRARQRLAQFKS